MTFKDWDECLKFLVVLTKWPPIILLIALVFRSAIAKKLADLKQITIKEKADIVFKTLGELKTVAAKTSPKLFQQFVLKLPQAAITDGEPDTIETQGEAVDDGGTDESAETDRMELEKQLKSLSAKRKED